MIFIVYLSSILFTDALDIGMNSIQFLKIRHFYLEEGYMTHESFNVAHVGKSGKEDLRGSSSTQGKL